ncbi:hypothetical protein AB0O76_12535 [Streptomyces sp. NPDC086554]|uniref:hypothetical protein n=1 Tax=Streptomyces sp. NPDC086554 TaxID=3154864 RepID=UPI00343391D5
MAIDTRETDVIIRSETGVRGYFEYQDGLNAKLRESLAQAWRPASPLLDPLFAGLLDAGKFAVAAELKVRESHRLVTVGRFPEEQLLKGPSVPYNAQAISSARKARLHTSSVLNALEQTPLRELQGVHREDGFRQALEEGREGLIDHLVKYNMSTPALEEVLGVWSETTQVVSEGGIGQGFREMAGHVDRFIELRGDPDRGTREHSPLPWWKYVLIASIIGVGIFGIVACFWWSACVWVWPAIALISPWVFGIIDRGC